MWIGTLHLGLFVYDGEGAAQFTKKEGLASNTVRTIYQTPDGVLWFGSHGGGVSLYDGVAWGTLDTRDGLAGDTVFKILQDSEGYLWFATNKGITRYHRNRVPPSVHITLVRTDKEYTEFEKIPPITVGNRVTIAYNSIDFKTLPQKRQYRCRIREIDSEWQTPTKATSFDCIFNEPGRYTFEVQAIDCELNYSEPARVELEVLVDPRNHRIAQLENELEKADEQLSLISQQEAERWGIDGFVGRSKAIGEILEEVRQLQTIGTTSVLITGESGVGKELIARAIHFGGERAKAPFIPVNCSTIPGELAESTLFGHVRGAFTSANTSRKGYFELADGGTLFLDEIGDMPIKLQPQLLRVLEDGCVVPVGSDRGKQVDVRVLAATNQNLRSKIAAGEFREDLYFRFVATVTVPPLRERKEDIPLFIEHFLTTFATEMGLQKPALSQEAFSDLVAYHFPGNIRELMNIIQRALLALRVSGGSIIQPQHLQFIEVSDSLTTKEQSPTAGLQHDNERSIPLEALKTIVEQLTQKPENHVDEKAPSLTTDEERILAYVRENESISNPECRDLLSVELHRASYLLKKMRKNGLLKREGEHRWTRYRFP